MLPEATYKKIVAEIKADVVRMMLESETVYVDDLINKYCGRGFPMEALFRVVTYAIVNRCVMIVKPEKEEDNG